MNYSEVQEKALAMERSILELIRDFENEINICVNSVVLERHPELGNRFGYLQNVKINVSL